MMDSAQFLIYLSFGAGLLFQSLFYLKELPDVKKLFWIILSSILVTGFVYYEFVSSIFVALTALFFTYTLSFSFYFKEKILPPANEQSLFQTSLVFLYASLVHTYPAPIKMWTILVAGAGTIITFSLSLTNSSYNSISKFFLYMWHILVNTILIVFVFPIGLGDLAEGTLNPSLNPFDYFIYGVVSFFLISHIFYIIALFPFPLHVNQSIPERINDIKKFISLFVSKFSNAQISPRFAFIILALQGGLYTVNYFTKLIPDYLLINLSIIIPSYFLRYLKTNSTVK